MIAPHRLAAALAGSAALLAAPAAFAHVSMDGPATAGAQQVLAFHIGHGCAGADTFRLEVHLPAAITTVRGVPSAWGDAQIVTDDGGVPTSVVWTKSDVKEADDQYYEFELRVRVPDAPFTTLYFPATQSCRTAEGDESTVEWDGLPGDTDDGEPAPSVVVLPPRAPGWNQLTAPAAIDDLESYFGDAQIVWVGDAAYSANPTTRELIAAEDGVDELSSIPAGAEIWVKY